MLPRKLQEQLNQRIANQSLRGLGTANGLVDFSSNDYLGFSRNKTIFKKAHEYLLENNMAINGATGSRLLSGNHTLYNQVEQHIADYHNAESALIFNSGYDANLGFFSAVPQRNDIIFYDELCHASIRDGISMGNAKAYKFAHNDLEQLSNKIKRTKQHLSGDAEIYVVTESVFSMDGDSPNFRILGKICLQHNINLVVDEAHAVGVFGDKGEGMIFDLKLEHAVCTRIVTFGKALGCHGAAILSSSELKQYLVNFSRPFIYTTGLPPHGLATIKTAYRHLEFSGQAEMSALAHLRHNIKCFKAEMNRLQLKLFIESDSAIQSCVIPGNSQVREISEALKEKGFNVKPIISPTVPRGHERLRFCLHSYNSEKEISDVLQGLAIFVANANI